MTTQTSKTRTITLTGRNPVKIQDRDWPILASATDDSHTGSDYGRHQQALSQGECDRYGLYVRQHADGRALVYGILDAAVSAWGAPAGGEDYRGGVLLASATLDQIAAAIREVGQECGLPDALIRECVANLPAEEI